MGFKSRVPHSDPGETPIKPTASASETSMSVWQTFLSKNVLARLFLRRKFVLHRWVGLVFLILWTAQFIEYHRVGGAAYMRDCPLTWFTPLLGVMQSVVAVCTFTFLPKHQTDPGYYGDKSTLSYNFIFENIFFAALLLFQAVYMHDVTRSYVMPAGSAIGLIIEVTWAYLPYAVIRPFFPKTRFRDSLNNKDKNKTDKNRTFFYISTWVTKIFYIWAKFFIGYYLNYTRFMGRTTEEQRIEIFRMLIFASFATTISMFLHTLKFKKYMGPVLSFNIYVASYMATFYSWIALYSSGIFTSSPDLVVGTLLGLAINVGPLPKAVEDIYQLVFAVACFAARQRGQDLFQLVASLV